MQQVGRNLTDAEAGALKGQPYVLHDRDTKCCDSFRSMLRAEGVTPLRLPARSPNLNSFAETWVRSVKEECLSKLILVGEGSLRRALNEYIAHFHSELNHQGKENDLLFPESIGRGAAGGRVECRSVWAACSGIMLGQHELFDSTGISALVRRGPVWLDAKGQADSLADTLVGLRHAVRVMELRHVIHDEQAAGLQIDMRRPTWCGVRADCHAARSAERDERNRKAFAKLVEVVIVRGDAVASVTI